MIALMLGVSTLDIDRKIKENPQALKQKIQQVTQQASPQTSQGSFREELIKDTPIRQAPSIVEPKANPEPSTTLSDDVKDIFKDEYQTIMNAAKRNKLAPEDYDLLFAIRKSENGGPRREFGIIHPKCEEQMKQRPNDTLDIQAGWAASTIVKNRARWEAEGKPGDFITFLGNRYAPEKVKNDPTNLNKNWIKNVSKWEERI